MDAALSTLQDECASQGLDYEEVIAQRSIEVKAFKEAGLVPPTWYGMPPVDQPDDVAGREPANKTAVKPPPT